MLAFEGGVDDGFQSEDRRNTVATWVTWAN